MTVTSSWTQGQLEVPGDGSVTIVDTCVEQELFEEVIEKLGFRED